MKIDLARSFEEQRRAKEKIKQEEAKMEQDFKQKMLEKFQEDDRIEQMNAQKRRMKELEHKREIERLWTERLAIYKAQREEEQREKDRAAAEELRKAEIIRAEKERLLRENAELLEKFYPKASAIEKTKYATNKSKFL